MLRAHPPQELKDHICRQLPTRSSSGDGKSRVPRKPMPAVELRLRLQDAAFVMQHHPLEV